jgi:hypothetical protein
VPSLQTDCDRRWRIGAFATTPRRARGSFLCPPTALTKDQKFAVASIIVTIFAVVLGVVLTPLGTALSELASPERAAAELAAAELRSLYQRLTDGEPTTDPSEAEIRATIGLAAPER